MATRGNCVGFIKTARECLKGIVITSQFNIAEKITCIVFDSQSDPGFEDSEGPESNSFPGKEKEIR